MPSPRRKRNPLNSKEVEHQIKLFALENSIASHLYQIITTAFEPINRRKDMTEINQQKHKNTFNFSVFVAHESPYFIFISTFLLLPRWLRALKMLNLFLSRQEM